MRRLALALLLLLPLPALAAPFLACDADPRATLTQIQFCTSINSATNPPSCNTWGTWSADTPVYLNGSLKECRHDLASVAIGPHVVRVRQIDPASAWTGGREESAPSAPFAFTRPASLPSPTGTRIAP